MSTVTGDGDRKARPEREGCAASTPTPPSPRLPPPPSADAVPYVRLLGSTVELIGEAMSLHYDPGFAGVLQLASRALRGFDPSDDMEDGVAALGQLAAVVARCDTPTPPGRPQLGHTMYVFPNGRSLDDR